VLARTALKKIDKSTTTLPESSLFTAFTCLPNYGHKLVTFVSESHWSVASQSPCINVNNLFFVKIQFHCFLLIGWVENNAFFVISVRQGTKTEINQDWCRCSFPNFIHRKFACTVSILH